MVESPPRFIFIAVALISLAAIGYEILLMRLLSIVQWHHFAYMIISLALLGYGTSGAFIAIGQRWFERRFEIVFAISALGFGVTMVACFIFSQRLPFNALEVIWNPRQLIYLSAIYLVFFVPFLFAATCVGLALTCLKNQISRIYFFDMFGAGIGALTAIAALFLLSPQNVLKLLALLALSASALVAFSTVSCVRKPLLWIQSFCFVVLMFGLPQSLLEFRISPFKGLSQALEVVDAKVIARHSNPMGFVTVVASPTVPYRDAPGLSLNSRSEIPEQLAVFTDSDSMSVVTHFDGNLESLAFTGGMTAALPYYFLEKPRVLILGAGGGADVLSALYHGGREIDAVELNPLMINLVRDDYSEFAGGIYQDQRVKVHLGEARGFVTKQSKRYDLIQVALLDSFSASGSGVQTLNESYLYTTEAFEEYLRHLDPGGILSITRWLRLPPRDSLKLFATAVEALSRTGVESPGDHLAMIRSWNTSTLLVKNGVFTESETGSIREFARLRSFDTAYYPSMSAGEANQFNILQQAYLYDGAQTLLSERAENFIDRYKFDIRPANDDRPYFFHFFKWRSLPEMLSLRKYGGAGMIEWAYLILVATLVQAVAAGTLLILMPLLLVSQNWPSGTGRRMGAYFFVLGIAFMFVEMAFIQKLILFLSHPLYSVAVVLCGFLVFAGLGSHYSRRLVARLSEREIPPVTFIVVTIVATALVYLMLLPELFSHLAGLSDIIKVAVSLMVIAPLAFFMGMPFPIGLAGLAPQAGAFIPWAWGLNGFASVVSASLATLLAIELGFSAVLLIALGLYLFAAALISKSKIVPGHSTS